MPQSSILQNVGGPFNPSKCVCVCVLRIYPEIEEFTWKRRRFSWKWRNFEEFTWKRRRFSWKWRNFRVRNTVWKNENFSLTKEKFRQINSLVIYLVKPLLSRNFCQKYVRENFRNFHAHCALVIFWQKFRESDWDSFTFTENKRFLHHSYIHLNLTSILATSSIVP